MRDLGPDEVAWACQMRRERRPWQFIADKLCCTVQKARNEVWAAEALGLQMRVDELAEMCGAGRTATFLKQCAQALETRL